MPSKYNCLAAQVRILQCKYDKAFPWDFGYGELSILDRHYARVQLKSHSIHMDHCALTGYPHHFPTSASAAARTAIGRKAQQHADRVHRQAASLRHPASLQVPQWRPKSTLRSEAPVFVPAPSRVEGDEVLSSERCEVLEAPAVSSFDATAVSVSAGSLNTLMDAKLQEFEAKVHKHLFEACQLTAQATKKFVDETYTRLSSEINALDQQASTIDLHGKALSVMKEDMVRLLVRLNIFSCQPIERGEDGEMRPVLTASCLVPMAEEGRTEDPVEDRDCGVRPVVLHGLKKESLNGLIGLAGEEQGASGRCPVELPSGDTVLVRTTNLREAAWAEWDAA
mmetsp:Transcript_94350/g.281558  ORF Transcript_94350/g.281558 Transcript_94350/m.281558 type:complete len:338 (+) Transcript_94350:117-1130(+)